MLSVSAAAMALPVMLAKGQPDSKSERFAIPALLC